MLLSFCMIKITCKIQPPIMSYGVVTYSRVTLICGIRYFPDNNLLYEENYRYLMIMLWLLLQLLMTMRVVGRFFTFSRYTMQRKVNDLTLSTQCLLLYTQTYRSSIKFLEEYYISLCQKNTILLNFCFRWLRVCLVFIFKNKFDLKIKNHINYFVLLYISKYISLVFISFFQNIVTIE